MFSFVFLSETAMTKDTSKLDKIVLQARLNAEKRAKGYREQALKLFPWVCGRCARVFDHKTVQLLEVHHKNNNHDDNPADGSNWELLCTYCHENEHAKVRDAAGRSDHGNTMTGATFNPFADLKERLKNKS